MFMNETENINLITNEKLQVRHNTSETYKQFILLGQKRIIPKFKNSIGLIFTFILIAGPTITLYTMYKYII